MKKIALMLALALMLTVLTGCGSEPQEAVPAETTGAAPVVLDLQAIYDSMTALEGTPEMIPLDADMQFNFCGINPDDCKTSLAAICADGMQADEIWLVEAVDAAALARLQEAAQFRLNAKDEESVTYSPEQNAIVKKAQVITVGNYLALVVSPDVDTLAGLFRTAAGI
ncbi:MAG: DUF4358 domain-containing protein [Oscillospiraceae bacterium]|nr:DUF4358 domain-containing protein [Oscillospiraceae bacterium]